MDHDHDNGADDDDDEHVFTHFSHDHPLKQAIATTKPNTTCSGCKHKILPYTNFYTCSTPTCTFSLHQLCYNVPRKTQHPAHAPHVLTLLATDPSTKPAFACSACGNQVSGLYYTCAECAVHYHILCSALPLSISTHSHAHPLDLEFSPPYDSFCDLCSKPSYNGWLYRCNLCEFDTHLECAVSSAKKMEIKCGIAVDNCNATSDQDFTSPSLQFSDAYFSIELSKSYANEVKETIGYAVSEDRINIVRDFDQARSRSKKQGFEDKVMVGGGTQVWEELSQKREGNEFNGRSASIKEQPSKSEITTSSKRSSWWKLFSFC